MNMKVGDTFTSKVSYNNITKGDVYEINEVPWNGNDVYFKDDAGNNTCIPIEWTDLEEEADMELLRCVDINHPLAKLTKDKSYKPFSQDNDNKVYGIIDDEDRKVFVDFFFFAEWGSSFKVGDKFKSLNSYINVSTDKEYEVISVGVTYPWVYFLNDAGTMKCLPIEDIYKIPVANKEEISSKIDNLRETLQSDNNYQKFDPEKFKSKIDFDVDLTALNNEVTKLICDIKSAETNIELLKLKLDYIKEDGRKRNVVNVGDAFIEISTGIPHIMLKSENKYSFHNMGYNHPMNWAWVDTIEEAIGCMCDLPFDLFFRKVQLEYKEL